MKTTILIILIVISYNCYSQNTHYGYSTRDCTTTGTYSVPIGYDLTDIIIGSFGYDGGYYNTLIGYGAGHYLTTESYCTIVGSDSIAYNLHGKDMLWYVDYNLTSNLLPYCIEKELRWYEDNIINKGIDTKEERIKLSKKIVIILNYFNKIKQCIII